MQQYFFDILIFWKIFKINKAQILSVVMSEFEPNLFVA